METSGSVGEEAEGSKHKVQAQNQEGQVSKGVVQVSNDEIQESNGELQKEIARSVLGEFGLRPFHVFDGERYHVCFAATEKRVAELSCGQELLDDFFSNCCSSPSTSSAPEDPCPLPEVLTAISLPQVAKDEVPNIEVSQNDCLSNIPTSEKEVYYIMEEFYLSPPPTRAPDEIHQVKEIQQGVQDGNVLTVHNPPVKEIHFVMVDQYFSPEELRLKLCFPSFAYPPSPPKDAPLDEPMDEPMDDGQSPFQAGALDDRDNGADIEDASTHSNAGKVKGDRVFSSKKNTKVIQECDASQSVRLDKSWAVIPRPRRGPKKVRPKEPPEEPPVSRLVLMDLEEQIGDSWVEEKFTFLPDENPGDVVNPGQTRKTFWPTPLYGSPGRQVKLAPRLHDKSSPTPSLAVSDEEESSEVEDFEECLEQSRKKEEVALAKYALLFKDDHSWRKKFLDGFKLTCDICFSKKKVKRFSSVMSLLAHAKGVKKLRQPEHRGYAQAIRNLLHLDDPGTTPACNSTTGDPLCPILGVWPPVLVLENTLLRLDHFGHGVGLTVAEMAEMLKFLGDQGKRKLHPVVGGNCLTGQVLVEFPASYRGWIDAKHMHHQFELHGSSYEEWLRLKPKYKSLLGDTVDVQESNGLVMVLADKSAVRRVLYGYLATPRVIQHIDPNKRYVNWEVENLKAFFDVSDSDCSQAV